MIYKNAARIMVLAAFFFAAPAFAQEESIGGRFFASCGRADGPETRIELDNHIKIAVFANPLLPDEAYRTKAEVADGERATMDVRLCDEKMEQCKSIEAIITTYQTEGDTIEAALEYFDGTEVQGDAESIEGHMISFKVQRDKTVKPPKCG